MCLPKNNVQPKAAYQHESHRVKLDSLRFLPTSVSTASAKVVDEENKGAK